MKYLDMENATLEIDAVSSTNLTSFLERYVDEIENLNITRLIINIPEDHIRNVVNMLHHLNREFKTQFVLKSHITNLNNIVGDSGFQIINTSNHFISGLNYYNEVSLSDKNLSIIVDAINSGFNVILNPDINPHEIYKFNNQLSILSDSLNKDELYLSGYFVPTSLMTEHPCNVYLCKGWQCGKSIVGLPRLLYLDKDGYLYPHNIVDKRVCMGLLSESLTSCFEKYLLSNEYQVFCKINKSIFVKYVPHYPYNLFPYDLFFKVELKNVT